MSLRSLIRPFKAENVQTAPSALPHTRAARFLEHANTSEHIARLGITRDRIHAVVSGLSSVSTVSLMGRTGYVAGNRDSETPDGEAGHDTF